MMTREEQIRVLEEQLNYNLTQMCVWQDQQRFDHAQRFSKQAADLSQTLIYLRAIPNPFGQVADPVSEKPKRRKLDMRNDDA